MPAYFALGFIAMMFLVYGLRWAAQVDPVALARALKYSAIALGVIGVCLLFIIGRIGLLFLVAGPLFLLWRRWQRGRVAADIGAGRSGRSSGIETVFLSVSLDHDTGTVDGRIKAGKFRDRRLADLTRADLLELLGEVRASDPQGVAVLEAYLDRIHGPDWRDDKTGEGAKPSPAAAGAMTREEAFEVLGLTPEATTAEIREAHHRLMMKVHPDHGGSSYLAARLNEARDRLLSN